MTYSGQLEEALGVAPGQFKVKITPAQQEIIGEFDNTQWLVQVGLSITGNEVSGTREAMTMLAGAYLDRADPNAGFDEVTPAQRRSAKAVAKSIFAALGKKAEEIEQLAEAKTSSGKTVPARYMSALANIVRGVAERGQPVTYNDIDSSIDWLRDHGFVTQAGHVPEGERYGGWPLWTPTPQGIALVHTLDVAASGDTQWSRFKAELEKRGFKIEDWGMYGSSRGVSIEKKVAEEGSPIVLRLTLVPPAAPTKVSLGKAPWSRGISPDDPRVAEIQDAARAAKVKLPPVPVKTESAPFMNVIEPGDPHDPIANYYENGIKVRLGTPNPDGLEAMLGDPAWIARDFGVADVTGDTARERAADLAYQLGWEEGHNGRKHSRIKGLLDLAHVKRWDDVAKSYKAGVADGRKGATEGLVLSAEIEAALSESHVSRVLKKNKDGLPTLIKVKGEADERALTKELEETYGTQVNGVFFSDPPTEARVDWVKDLGLG